MHFNDHDVKEVTITNSCPVLHITLVDVPHNTSHKDVQELRHNICDNKCERFHRTYPSNMSRLKKKQRPYPLEPRNLAA